MKRILILAIILINIPFVLGTIISDTNSSFTGFVYRDTIPIYPMELVTKSYVDASIIGNSTYAFNYSKYFNQPLNTSSIVQHAQTHSSFFVGGAFIGSSVSIDNGALAIDGNRIFSTYSNINFTNNITSEATICDVNGCIGDASGGIQGSGNDYYTAMWTDGGTNLTNSPLRRDDNFATFDFEDTDSINFSSFIEIKFDEESHQKLYSYFYNSAKKTGIFMGYNNSKSFFILGDKVDIGSYSSLYPFYINQRGRFDQNVYFGDAYTYFASSSLYFSLNANAGLYGYDLKQVICSNGCPSYLTYNEGELGVEYRVNIGGNSIYADAIHEDDKITIQIDGNDKEYITGFGVYNQHGELCLGISSEQSKTLYDQHIAEVCLASDMRQIPNNDEYIIRLNKGGANYTFDNSGKITIQANGGSGWIRFNGSCIESSNGGCV